jgi:ATP-dependent DNA helicase PIF1
MLLKNNRVKVEKLIPDSIQDLLKEHLNLTINFEDNLSESQKHAFKLFKENKNVVILGSAGVGKSLIIKTMEEYIKTNKRDSKIYLCSTTGISAYNIGGMTIHSFMGIGTGEMEIDVLICKVNRKKKYRDRIITTDILVIDEVSMLSAELFEKLNRICQAIRKSKQFFGGIQLILTGDLAQICPVFNRNIEFTKGEEQDSRLIIESQDFTNEFNKKNANIIILKENFRQKGDPTFINLLLRIREGKQTEEDINILKSRFINPKAKIPVNLVSSNKSAQIINESNLEKIKEPVNKYISIYKDYGKDKDTNELLVKELKFQFKQKGVDTLELKKGARVMLTKNMDVSIGLVNGTLGTIDSFIQVENIQTQVQEYPVVIFDNIPEKKIILPISIELELDGCKASATQIPLMLAYAITIHRSQSLTLDSAVLDLAECFADGQVYVALSRVRSLDGLYLKSFNPAKIKVNKKMTEYLKNNS